jgi:hypothetical protein
MVNVSPFPEISVRIVVSTLPKECEEKNKLFCKHPSTFIQFNIMLRDLLTQIAYNKKKVRHLIF